MIHGLKTYGFSPILWIIYFGSLFTIYFEALNIGGITFEFMESPLKALEFRWRIIWGLFSIFLILICTINILISARIAWLHTRSINSTYKTGIVSLLLVIVAFMIYLFSNSSLGGSAVTNLLASAQTQTGIKVGALVDVTMILSAIAILFIASSSSSMLIRPSTISIDFIRKRYFYFKWSFYSTSIFLGIGILQVYLLFTWASYATGKSEATLTMAHALTISGSVIYTAVFIALFVPISIVFNSWLREVAESNSILSEDDYLKWKRSAGLANTPSRNIANLAVLFSPVIFGALTNILSEYLV